MSTSRFVIVSNVILKRREALDLGNCLMKMTRKKPERSKPYNCEKVNTKCPWISVARGVAFCCPEQGFEITYTTRQLPLFFSI